MPRYLWPETCAMIKIAQDRFNCVHKASTRVKSIPEIPCACACQPCTAVERINNLSDATVRKFRVLISSVEHTFLKA